MQRIDIQHNIEPGKSYNQNCVISKKCTTNNNDCTSANTAYKEMYCLFQAAKQKFGYVCLVLLWDFRWISTSFCKWIY